MILYSNAYRDFRYDGSHLELTPSLVREYTRVFHRRPNPKEVDSWNNSLKCMQLALSNVDIADDCGVLIEYNLPNTSRRIDFVITGENEEQQKHAVIVELKQWQQAESTAMDGVVRTALGKGIHETSHPSYQAFGYKRFLNNFNEEFYSGNITADSCAFLHNYQRHDPEPLLDEVYTHYVEDTPVFFQKDIDLLADFIAGHVGRGRGMEILYAVENGRIRPSVKLIDAVGSLFRGNEYFTLIDEQKVLYERILHTPVTDTKQVVIINGGPGTGKSVVSFNLLYGMLKRRKNVVLAAPNAAFRSVMTRRLQQAGLKRSTKDPLDTMVLDSIISGSASFHKIARDHYDVIIVDEAHRLKDSSAYQYSGENQIEDVINAARISVFFVDDSQVVKPEDIGNTKNIRAAAERAQATVAEHTMDVQFRCSGMQGYIKWVDHSLRIRDTANFASWDTDAFSFEICDSPHEVYALVKEKDREGFQARMLAGYAWKWTSEKAGNPDGQIPDVIIEEHQFAMPWNSRKARTTWAIDPTGLDQIGCIHTSQGLEFDYVGVIFGRDLQYDPVTEQLFVSWKDYKDVSGKKGLKEDPEYLTQLVKNIYKVLLTRAMKGCFIFCQDRHLQEYLRSCLPAPPASYTGTQTEEQYVAE